MKTLSQKLEQAKKLVNALVKVKDRNNLPCERYYFVLRIFQETRNKLNLELNSKINYKFKNL